MHRGRVVPLLVGLVVGGAAGLVVYWVLLLPRWGLFVVAGCVVGAGVMVSRHVVSRLLGGQVRLTSVKVTVPQVSELTFVVNDDARRTAWTLFVETVTRVSTQPLADDAGLVRETLTSLYGLFGTARDVLKVARPSVPVAGSRTVEHLAVTMLNLELRPFLSTWHPRLAAFEREHPDASESAWPHREECRRDLARVREHLVTYAQGFARLAGVRDADAMTAHEIGAQPRE